MHPRGQGGVCRCWHKKAELHVPCSRTACLLKQVPHWKKKLPQGAPEHRTRGYYDNAKVCRERPNTLCREQKHPYQDTGPAGHIKFSRASVVEGLSVERKKRVHKLEEAGSANLKTKNEKE